MRSNRRRANQQHIWEEVANGRLCLSHHTVAAPRTVPEVVKMREPAMLHNIPNMASLIQTPIAIPASAKNASPRTIRSSRGVPIDHKATHFPQIRLSPTIARHGSPYLPVVGRPHFSHCMMTPQQPSPNFDYSSCTSPLVPPGHFSPAFDLAPSRSRASFAFQIDGNARASVIPRLPGLVVDENGHARVPRFRRTHIEGVHSYSIQQ